MKEEYLGTVEDQRYVRTYLENIRRLDPLEIATLPNPFTLADPRIEEMLDVLRFQRIVSHCIEECQRRYKIRLTPVKTERYYTAEPPESNLGGFHGLHSLGYQYWYHAAFVVLLDRRLVSKELRTIEMIRNFLHDCFHHSTYRSFRRVIRIPAASANVAKNRVPEVYREQYGINFRDQDGFSYSTSRLTERSPEAINLNLLMDGAIILVIAELMREAVGDEAHGSSQLEKEIRKEIFLEPFDAFVLQRAHRFYKSVIEPSQLFIEHWGGRDFTVLVLQAMMSGELQALKQFFDEKTGTQNVWEKRFKRPGFRLPSNPEI
ncbi:MAG: hypothetical protein A2928_00505 [Candidatus Taylorbacteria bacterium RIFCSPLOWO2_01_FULL_45_15b]|uniref:Uncharacterized protein n=1 Tax=Candidatus Taylorbacteria bacterium RIFCSPLOWO2_01_FULL_45_15b TaxID=1802319 RepID=A0A1G2N9V4_9BACT|nr:MAG: hypothetical protein A2928_00505 [Candidatus Taylorbacteria bacterium RIFCSPLOWO2_01_FULL_45_15b]